MKDFVEYEAECSVRKMKKKVLIRLNNIPSYKRFVYNNKNPSTHNFPFTFPHHSE